MWLLAFRCGLGCWFLVALLCFGYCVVLVAASFYLGSGVVALGCLCWLIWRLGDCGMVDLVLRIGFAFVVGLLGALRRFVFAVW